jgi:hypothetical protein
MHLAATVGLEDASSGLYYAPTKICLATIRRRQHQPTFFLKIKNKKNKKNKLMFLFVIHLINTPTPGKIKLFSFKN